MCKVSSFGKQKKTAVLVNGNSVCFMIVEAQKRNPGMPLARLTQCHHSSAHPGQVPSAFGRGRALPVHQSPTVHNMSSFWHARPDTFHTVTIATNCPARVTKGNFVSQKPLTVTHSTQCNKRHDRAHFVVPQKSP